MDKSSKALCGKAVWTCHMEAAASAFTDCHHRWPKHQAENLRLKGPRAFIALGHTLKGTERREIEPKSGREGTVAFSLLY